MRQISSTAVSIVALIILIFIYQQATSVGAPNYFNIIIVLMAVLIVINIIRVWLRF